MTPPEILSRAADLLEARGWGCTVLHETIVHAAGGTSFAAMHDALELARERAGERCLIRWGERFERTLPQVLAMLRGNDWRNA